MAPSSLKGAEDGFGVYTTRRIRRNQALLQSGLPDAPSIPVLDYEFLPLSTSTTTKPNNNHKDPDDNTTQQTTVQQEELLEIRRARRQFIGLFDNYWWGRGKPDHVSFLTHGSSIDFQITFGSLPNHHCVLDAVEAFYPHSRNADGYAPHDDSYDRQQQHHHSSSVSSRNGANPTTRTLLLAGAISYHNGRNFTARRTVEAGEELFLNYGHCDPHPNVFDFPKHANSWQRHIPVPDDFQHVVNLLQTHYRPWLQKQQQQQQQQQENHEDRTANQLSLINVRNPLVQRLLPKTRAELERVLLGYTDDTDETMSSSLLYRVVRSVKRVFWMGSKQENTDNNDKSSLRMLQRVARYLGTTPRSVEWIVFGTVGGQTQYHTLCGPWCLYPTGHCPRPSDCSGTHFAHCG